MSPAPSPNGLSESNLASSFRNAHEHHIHDPIPPTKSEIPTIPARTTVAAMLIVLKVDRISSWVRMLKSLG